MNGEFVPMPPPEQVLNRTTADEYHRASRGPLALLAVAIECWLEEPQEEHSPTCRWFIASRCPVEVPCPRHELPLCVLCDACNCRS